MYKQNDLAYAAGYIDGDGCLYIGSYNTNKGTTYEYSIQVCSVNLNIINWLKEKFGGATRTKERRPNQKQVYIWTIKNKQCIELVQQLKPYLIAKHRETYDFIEFALHVSTNAGYEVNSDMIEHREILINRIRKQRHEDNIIEKNYVMTRLKELPSFPNLLTNDNFAYLAGLIDAEGCFRVKHYSRKNRPNKIYNICLEIGNTNKIFFEWLLLTFGGSVYFVKPSTDKKKPAAVWYVQSQKLFELLPNIALFIKHKKPLVEKLLEFTETILPNGGDRHSAKFKEIYATILLKREKLINEIQQLNSKGHKDSE